MRKSLVLWLAFVGLFFEMRAQSALPAIQVPWVVNTTKTAPAIGSLPEAGVRAVGDTLWSNGFEDPSQWSATVAGDPNVHGWSIGTQTNGWYFTPPEDMGTTGNFARFQNGIPGDIPSPLEMPFSFTYLETIDLSEAQAPILEFEQYGARFIELQAVQVSTDMGATWVTVGSNNDIPPLTQGGGAIYPKPMTRQYALATAIASNPSSVSLRLFWDGLQNGPTMNYVAYGWYVDNLRIVEGAENDVRIANYASYTDFEETGVFEYTIWPVSQLTPLTAAANVVNVGSNAQEVFLDLELNGNPLGYTPEVVALATGEEAIVRAQDYALPAVPGSYVLSMNATLEGVEDENPEDNLRLAEFEVSQYTYARDNGQFGGSFPALAFSNEFTVVNGFQSFAPMTIYAIDVAFTSAAPNAFVEAQLVDGNLDYIGGGSLFVHPSFVNTNPEEEPLNFVTIALDEPVTIQGDQFFGGGIFAFGGQQVRIATGSNTLPNQTSFILGNFGSAGYTWYFITSSVMLRLNLDPNAQSTPAPIEGCTDASACNFNPQAQWESGDCFYPGDPCDDGNPNTENDAIQPNCLCQGTPIGIPGCINMAACNYDPQATTDDGSCAFPGDPCDDANPNTINDQFQPDCTCLGTDVGGETPGCTDSEACNYAPEATIDDGSCAYFNPIALNGFLAAEPGVPVGYFVSGTTAGSTYEWTTDGVITFVLGTFQVNALWNAPGTYSLCVIETNAEGCVGNETCIEVLVAFQGCTDPNACNYDEVAEVDDDSCILPGDPCDDGNPNTFNDTVQEDCECEGIDVSGEVLGCTDVAACNYSEEATFDDGSCSFFNAIALTGSELVVPGVPELYSVNPTEGSTYEWVTTNATVEFVSISNEVSIAWDEPGVFTLCVIETNAAGCVGNEVCITVNVFFDGCTDEDACNFNENAGIDDGSCGFPGDPCDDGNPDTFNDAYQENCECEGIDVSGEVLGCTDEDACNYDDEATFDDGSCEYVDLFTINGPENPVIGQSVNYFYAPNDGSSYAWTTQSGTIVSGQGTFSVNISWAEETADQVCVTETRADGCEGDQVCLNVNAVVNVEDLERGSEVKCYPNPANEWVVLQPENPSIQYFTTLYDLQGKVLLNAQHVGQTLLDISGLSTGVYVLSMQSDNHLFTTRLVVQR